MRPIVPALVLSALVVLAGCAKRPQAPGSDVPPSVACKAAKAAAIVMGLDPTAPGTICHVPTGSMVPAIAPGSYVVATPTPPDLLGITAGDILLYATPATPGHTTTVVHRVTGIDHTTRTLTLQGDANPRPDAPVPFADVRGRVVAVFYAAPTPAP